MSTFQPIPFFFLLFFIFHSVHSSTSSSSFSFDLSANPNSSTVSSDLTLFGDAVVSAVHLLLTSPKQWSSGRLVFKNPVKFFSGTPTIKASFSAYISFHIPNSHGAALDFSLLPALFPFDSLDIDFKSRVFVLQFVDASNSSSIDPGINRLVYVKSSTDSSVILSVNSTSERIHCWIEYKAASNLLEVRISTSSNQKPTSPSLSQQIYLLSTTKEDQKEVFVALTCWNGNSTDTCEIYSWDFKTRVYPQWLHSQPLFPKSLEQKGVEEQEKRMRKQKAGCFLRFIGALVLGAGCGAVVATVGLFLWAIFVPGKDHVVAEETVECPYDYGYKKIRVVLGKGSSSEDNTR